MQSFKITKEELLKFAERLYSEGCFGYFDLCEATADRMVTDFLDGREPITPSILSQAGFAPSVSFATGPTVTVAPQGLSIDPAGPPPAVWGGVGPMMGGVNVPVHGSNQSVSITVSGGGPPMTDSEYRGHGDVSLPPSGAPETAVGSSSDGIIIMETPVIREEVFTRQENFVGNPSERI